MPDSILNDSSLMAALGREMTRAVQRQALAAGNLANAETPGYKAREVQFSQALAGQLDGQSGLQPTMTDPRHLGGAATDEGQVTEVDAPARRDGNTVQMERELLALNKAGTDFAAAQTVLAAKFRLVRYAINEGR